MIRVLRINLTYGFGGVERTIEGYARQSSEAGFADEYVTTDLTALKPHLAFLRSCGSTCHVLSGYEQASSGVIIKVNQQEQPVRRKSLRKRVLAIMPERGQVYYHHRARIRIAEGRMFDWLQTVNPVVDLCHLHASTYFEAAGIFRSVKRWRSDMPVLVHFHNGPVYFDPTVYERAMISNAQMCLFNSCYTRDAWSACARPKRSVVLPNPVILPPTPPPARSLLDREIILGSLGRLSPIKGVDIAIKSFARVVERYPHLRLEIAGDGPERARLEACAQRTGCGDRIRFLGFVDDPGALLSRWHLLLQTTTTVEAFGRTVIEAAAHRCGVISTPVGGLSELIEDGINGWLVPPGDEGALADSIMSVMESSDGYERVVDEGNRRAQRYRAEKITEELGNIYRAIGGR
jgi:glycosyltransferase involved in cell wall biosynthesis